MKRTISALFMVTIMLILAFSAKFENLDPEAAQSKAEGRQIDSVDCTGYKFEDLFTYDFANFNIEINDDWASGQYEATAFANVSNAASVRKDLDGLFDGFHGGNNSWISTDERDAVRAVGPMCVADMETRLAITEGNLDRSSEDLNNLSFFEDGIALDEQNLIPENHPEKKQCTNIGASASCKEVPVSATDNLEIDLTLEDGQEKNVEFTKLPNSGASNFTMTINSTAMVDADVRIVFPPTNGLRLANFEVLDNGLQSVAINQPTTQYLGDGSLEILMDVVYNLQDLPMERFIYLDFTTEEPQFNSGPQWSSSSPSSGNIFMYSGLEGTEFELLDGGTVQNWGFDDQGWSLNCSFDQTGWELTQNQDFDVIITKGSSETAQMECGLIDQYGLTTDETRNWTIGIPFTATGEFNSETKMVDFQLTDKGLASDYTLAIKSKQGDAAGEILTVVVNSDIAVSVTTDGLSPGDFNIFTRVTGDNIIPWDYEFDFQLELPNSPPTVEIRTNLNGEYGTWNAQKTAFTMSGTVIDPEGQQVSMTWSLCGGTSSNFQIQGNSWETEVSTITCVQQGIEEYEVVIKAEDDSGLLGSKTVVVSDGSEEQIEEPQDLSVEEPQKGIPNVGIISTMLSVLLAGLFIARRQQN